jgi:hypothetical protein
MTMKNIEKTLRSRARRALTALALLGVVTGVGAFASVLGTAPEAGASPASNRCVFAKQQAALKRMRAVTKCYQKAAERNDQDPDPVCLMTAEARFDADFQRIERSGNCVPMTGDAPSVGHFADQCAKGLFQVLPGECLPQGAECGVIGYCCSPYVCMGAIGQEPTCR